MLARIANRQITRGFQTSARNAVHFKEGVYENIPFRVHNRRIPYAILHFGFFGLGFAIPFVACGIQLKRSGAF